MKRLVLSGGELELEGDPLDDNEGGAADDAVVDIDLGDDEETPPLVVEQTGVVEAQEALEANLEVNPFDSNDEDAVVSPSEVHTAPGDIEIFDVTADGNVALTHGDKDLRAEAPPANETRSAKCSRICAERIDLLKPTCPPSRGDIMQYLVELVGFIVSVVLVFTVVDTQTRGQLWWLPFAGIVAATIAMATPAGGGVIYFPVLTVVGRSTESAVAFSVGAQFIGMGVYGTLNWVRAAPKHIHIKALAIVLLFSLIGMLLGFFAIPEINPFVVRITFSCFTMLLAIYVLVAVFFCKMSAQKGKLNIIFSRPWTATVIRDWAVLALTGLVGGFFISVFGTGVDVVFFFVTSLFYKLNAQTATVSSILAMAWSSLFAFIILAAKQEIPWFDWLMVLPGVIVGARVGPLLNLLVGKTVILIVFAFILSVDFIRTMVDIGNGTVI